jgi:hypothetical protein
LIPPHEGGQRNGSARLAAGGLAAWLRCVAERLVRSVSAVRPGCRRRGALQSVQVRPQCAAAAHGRRPAGSVRRKPSTHASAVIKNEMPLCQSVAKKQSSHTTEAAAERGRPTAADAACRRCRSRIASAVPQCLDEHGHIWRLLLSLACAPSTRTVVRSCVISVHIQDHPPRSASSQLRRNRRG